MDDAELARAIRAGNAEALAEAFDRHAGRVHDLALAMLRDHRAALEVTEATFVEAASRVSGLQEDHRLAVWLLAVARRNGALRAGPTAGIDRRPTLPPDDDRDRTYLAGQVWEAVADLPLRERTLIHLDAAYRLEGQDLADALGFSVIETQDLQRRMSDRIEKGLAGYLSATTPTGGCPGLAKMLKGWDRRFTPSASARIAEHVDTCSDCNKLRFGLPSPFVLYADALPAPFPAVVRPHALAHAVLPAAMAAPADTWGTPQADLPGGVAPVPPGLPTEGVPVVAALPIGAEPWMPNGFPPPSFVIGAERVTTMATARGRWLVAAAVLGTLLLLAGLVLLAQGNDDKTALKAGPGTTAPTVPAPTASSSPTTLLDPTAGNPEATVPPTLPSFNGIVGGVPTVTVAPAAAPPTTRAAAATPAPTTSPGALSTSATSVTLTTTLPGQPGTASVVLKNAGKGPLSYTSQTSNGLSATPATGSLGPDQSVTVDLSLKGDTLGEGQYFGSVLFQGAGNKAVQVRGTVAKPPTIKPADQNQKYAVLAAGQTACAADWSIRAAVTDEDPITGVKVRFTSPASEAAMETDAVDGDGHGTWKLAQTKLAAGSTVKFVVVAVDSLGNESVTAEEIVTC